MKENVSGCFFSEHSVHVHRDDTCRFSHTRSTRTLIEYTLFIVSRHIIAVCTAVFTLGTGSQRHNDM